MKNKNLMTDTKHIKNQEIYQELKEISPSLARLGKSNAFVVDDNYFSELSNNIQNKILETTKSLSPKQKHWFLKPQYSISIAAAVLILIAFAINYFSVNNTNDEQNNIEQNFIANQNSSDVHSKNPNKTINRNNDKELEINKLDSKESSLIASDEEQINLKQKSHSNINKEKNLSQDKINSKDNKSNYASNSNQSQAPRSSISNHTHQESSNPIATARHGSNNNNPKNQTSSSNNKPIVKIYKKPVVDLGKDICSNKAVELTAGNKEKLHTYLWSTGQKTSTIKVSKTGKYSVTVSLIEEPDVFSKDDIQVRILDKPLVNLGLDQTICSNETITLYAADNKSNNEYKYKWSPNGESSSFLRLEKLSAGVHKFSVDVIGCKTYKDEITITVNKCELEIPNIFTPNSDGVNDYFKISGLENYPNTKLFIFDRNGVKIYESNNYLNNWNGDNAQDGVYYYKLFVADESQTIRQGSITIYRR